MSEILAASSSTPEWQKKRNYKDVSKKATTTMHHNEQDGDRKQTQEKRYYIYSIKNVNGTIDDNDDDEMIRNDKSDDIDKISRKTRSSNKISDYDRKQVSKNISMVLENLLMSYENSQLPTHGQGLIGFLSHIRHRTVMDVECYFLIRKISCLRFLLNIV